MVKRENQRNASVLGCEQSKDHYVANPFTFYLGESTSARIQQQLYRALFAPTKLGSHYHDARKS